MGQGPAPAALQASDGRALDPAAQAPSFNDNRPRRDRLSPLAKSVAQRVAPDAFTEMRSWIGVLERLSIPVDLAARIAARADLNRTAFQEELLASGVCHEEGLYHAIADDLGLRFLAKLDSQKLMVRERDFASLLAAGTQRSVQYVGDSGSVSLVSYETFHLEAMRRFLAMDGRLRDRIVVVPRKTLNAALRKRLEAVVASHACDGLYRAEPDCSASYRTTRWQALMIAAILMALPVGFSLWPSSTLYALHAIASLFFLACIVLRFLAAREANPPVEPRLTSVRPRDLPVYTIMVALYREAPVVPQLLEALDRIVWPKSKLEIKLVCEMDDRETIAAIRALDLRPNVDLVEVPPAGPRTKPKALNYALPLATGEFITVYDAEDRPHPLQLMEAWQTFRDGDPSLACLQAPLVISNGNRNLLTRLFAFEYAALFRGLLPWLAKRSLVLPLGGTSNHFRRAALVGAGAWDPHNVTEDADLGLRLARFGYRIGTLHYPTLEDAPTEAGVWLRQRTRWYKGWIQTWFVHMRNPLRLWRELGTGSFLVVQVVMAGMVVSALLHPLLLLTVAAIGVEIVFADAADPGRSVLFAVDSINAFCGYAAFLALGAATLMPFERRSLWRVVLATPVYWLMVSAASFRAVWHFYRKPFLWEKTPHGPYAEP